MGHKYRCMSIRFDLIYLFLSIDSLVICYFTSVFKYKKSEIRIILCELYNIK